MARNFRQQQEANRKKLRILLAVFFSFTAAAGWFAGSGFERLRDPVGMDPAFGEPARPPYRDYRYLMTPTALLLGVAHMMRLRMTSSSPSGLGSNVARSRMLRAAATE